MKRQPLPPRSPAPPPPYKRPPPTVIRLVGVAPAKKSMLRWLDVDRLLGATGVTAAICSASFAGMMLSGGDHRPYIFGRQYLALFSRPSSFSRAPSALPIAQTTQAVQIARAEPSAAPDPARAGSSPRFDPMPTGSLPPPSSYAANSAGAPTHLVSANKDHAWFAVGTGYEEVGPGDFVPRIGQIDQLRLVDGVWSVVLKDGTVIGPSDASAALPFASSAILAR